MDPLKPDIALLCKLGSLIVHAEEFMTRGGHSVDWAAFKVGMKDPDVQEWLAAMTEMALITLKR
jgi:hypothetical protein